jgi:hypothetical protein
MNPFLALRPLTTNIEHAVLKRAEIEMGLCYTSGP